MPAGRIAKLGHGTIIQLKAIIDSDMVSLMVNGCKIAAGEVCSTGDRFGVRIISLVHPDERQKRLNILEHDKNPLADMINKQFSELKDQV